MNLLVPDFWLREYLKTKATSSQIKEYLSLCGPSVERIDKIGSDTVYDIEVTSNRPDSMSVVGIAREAAAILPRFGLAAKLINDPYKSTFVQGSTLHNKVEPFRKLVKKHEKARSKKLTVTTDFKLNPRFTAIVIDNVKVGPSPDWLRQKLEATGLHSLNNVIDITNYLMRAFGQPAHVFDYDEVKPASPRSDTKKDIPTMVLRASKKGEKITTLDEKTHILAGNDIVIEDGSGRLIDLCGIMGAKNSSIKDTTKTVVLFMQTYDPAHIRHTSMSLAHRTEAGSLFEKGLDHELVLPTILKGVELMEELTGGKVASQLYDLYPEPYKPYSVSVKRDKVDSYLATALSEKEIRSILEPLGLSVTVTAEAISAMIPSFRQDITIDMDIIEELARIYGYHNISTRLPGTELPLVLPDKTLAWEEEIKMRLRDWGYTELITYSMISEKQMEIFGLDKHKAYKIANPLSNDWVYMRPALWPNVLAAVEQNLRHGNNFKLFELSMVYVYQQEDLPVEHPMLLVTWMDKKFGEAKGLAEVLFSLFGIPFPTTADVRSQNTSEVHQLHTSGWFHANRYLPLGNYGSVGEVSSELLDSLGIKKPVTILELDFANLVQAARPARTYKPNPKYPPSFEDLAFVLPPRTNIGPLIAALQDFHPLVANVELLDSYGQTRTLHITYQNPKKNLTSEDLVSVRKKLIEIAQEKFGASLKESLS